MKATKFLLAIFSSVAVAACGGGGGGGGGGSASASISNTISGIAAKGSISGAEVLVFKAGDYSGSADDGKALNASSPAPTDAAGRYSVSVSYSGPVIVVVRPKSSGSTMCDESTGVCTVPFNFRMRAALPGVAAHTTAHITPFTEMAANAVGTSSNPDLIKTANTVVRTQILAGLDPLTISPVVDSNDPTAQAFQKQMVVALAAVAQASNGGWVGNYDCSAATTVADATACAVGALSNTVTNLNVGSADIDTNNVAAFSDAIFKLGVIHIPTLDSNGSLDTSATMDTSDQAETEYWVLENNVAATSKYLTDHASGGMASTDNLPNGLPGTTALNGADQAKAFFGDLRTNLHLFVNGTNGLLDNQGLRINDDLNSVIAPDAVKDIQLLKLMMSGAQLFTTGTPVSGSNFSCTPTSPSVTCLVRSEYAASGAQQNYMQVVLTSTGATSLTYTALAMQCTSDGSVTGVGCAGSGSYLYGKATGSGSISWTADSSGNLTGLTIPDGSTFPGSSPGIYQDNVALSGTLTVPAAGSQRLDFSGSVSSYDYDGTTAMASTTAMVSLALDSGSYATSHDVFHTACGCTYAELSDANVILVANTVNTKFTGTLAMSSFMFDHSGTQWNPTSATFTGSIADTSTAGAGEFMTGKLELTARNYASYNATLPEAAFNPHQLTTKFAGLITFPGAQPMNVLLAMNHAGLKSAFISANLSYGSGKTISVYSSPVDPTLNSNSITLTNQDGLLVTLTQGQNSVVRNSLSEIVATVSHNIVNYSDGYVESLY